MEPLNLTPSLNLALIPLVSQGSPDSRVDPVDFVKKHAFNIVKEKTTSDLLKALSNMYEKPSAMNKIYLMR